MKNILIEKIPIRIPFMTLILNRIYNRDR